jgi:hypothetical protein
MANNNEFVLTNADSKRRYDLNDKAVKDARAGAVSLQAAAASGMFMLMHGHPHFINDLYVKLANDKNGSPKDAEALRVMYANRVRDIFGKGGIRKVIDGEVSEDVWERRPTKFFDFSGRSENGKIKGFFLIDVKDNKALSPKDIKEIKAARKEIRDAGEKALDFMWKSADAERRDAEAMDATALQRMVGNLLMKISKNAATNGIEKNKLAAAGRALGLSGDKLKGILDNFNDGSHSDETEEETPAKTEELIKANANAKAKKEPEAAHAH